MFLCALCNLVEWGLGVEDFYDVLWILGNLFDLVSGVFLMLFGIKLMNTEFLEAIIIEKTLVYFLLFWAGQFFFCYTSFTLLLYALSLYYNPILTCTSRKLQN